MLRHLRPECINQNVIVGQDHVVLPQRFNMSRSAHSSSAVRNLTGSTPGRRPPPWLEMGILSDAFSVCGAPVDFWPATTIRRPSSMREVNVRPSVTAFFLARWRRSSGTWTVVRICLNILLKHMYVNRPLTCYFLVFAPTFSSHILKAMTILSGASGSSAGVSAISFSYSGRPNSLITAWLSAGAMSSVTPLTAGPG
jgi:hypothetical protein